MSEPIWMKQRRSIVKHPFGTIKWLMGNPRFLLRGLKKAKAELALSVLSYSLKRAINIHGLHMLIFWVCVAIGVVVFGVMIYSLVTFRKSKGAVPDVKMVHNTKVEIIWTVIPVAILVAMAVLVASSTLTSTTRSRSPG